MADFVPAPGTRVTVGGVTWEWTNSTLQNWPAWVDVSGLRGVPAREKSIDLTRIAEVEARLARYAAIGEEAWRVAMIASPTAEEDDARKRSIIERLAAEYRAQEGR